MELIFIIDSSDRSFALPNSGESVVKITIPNLFDTINYRSIRIILAGYHGYSIFENLDDVFSYVYIFIC